MNSIRIYRKFYSILYSQGSYTSQFMSPVFLSANSYVSTTGNSVSTLVEQGLPITETEEGVYYAQINPELYRGDLSYEIQWYVQYTEDSNINTLSNKFLINNYNAALAISVELIN